MAISSAFEAERRALSEQVKIATLALSGYLPSFSLDPNKLSLLVALFNLVWPPPGRVLQTDHALWAWFASTLPGGSELLRVSLQRTALYSAGEPRRVNDCVLRL